LRREEGQAVVEFAMVLPVLAALVIVLIQFGGIMYRWISLTHLANEGARYAAVNIFPGQSNGGPASPGAFLCPKLGADKSATAKTVAVTFTSATTGAVTSAPVAGDSVNVKVSESYQLIPFGVGKLVNFPSIPLSVTASMRLEQTPSYSGGSSTC
jgi:Flp pilus assembly protein TadG